MPAQNPQKVRFTPPSFGLNSWPVISYLGFRRQFFQPCISFGPSVPINHSHSFIHSFNQSDVLSALLHIAPSLLNTLPASPFMYSSFLAQSPSHSINREAHFTKYIQHRPSVRVSSFCSFPRSPIPVLIRCLCHSELGEVIRDLLLHGADRLLRDKASGRERP